MAQSFSIPSPDARACSSPRRNGKLRRLPFVLALGLAGAPLAHGQTNVQNAPQAKVQTDLHAGVQAGGPTNSLSQLQTGGTSRAALDPAAAAAVSSGSAFPGIPPATPPIYARRSAPLCADFQPVANGGWSALGPIQFPGPQGPVQMVVGQTVVPGDYLDGMDLGSVLQRDCVRRPPVP